MSNNISSIHNCYGCGVCAAACAKKIIEIKLNDKGFYEPRIINTNKCTNCGLCMDVCAFNHQELANDEQRPLKSYAAWSKEYAVQRKCSSGGVGYELGRTLLTQGYQVCGVRYNPEGNRAEHYIASTPEELIPAIGSKYIQSYTVDGFRAIDRKKKYLVTGTPCQMDSFRRYIRKFKVEDNFVLMDFFCHSVPSMLAWKQYLHIVEQTVGKVNYVSWRNKRTGWHDSWAMSIDGEKTADKVNWHDSYNLLIRGKKNYLYSRLSQGDIFYNLFLGDFCCNRACQKECKYKYNQSSADIRIGDLWGKTYSKNEDGVSALVAFTQKGCEIVQQLNCQLTEHPFEIVAEGQMKQNCHTAHLAAIAWKWLLSGKYKDAKDWKRLILAEKVLQLPKRVIRKIKSYL
ncbi:Coenzyme F420 hydrogenase/dehydrogenase, beta subunit C-terminal domain [uncultured Phocaeicola sp.]|uniref:Coenzyme F420 hydrogenase/dehydrogenase, beta subunit C-terminal domain n=1 Tax=uncultured Phocaeicola sp. TaxID=990718 RepID=UPI0025A24184|nr:Coenzyme F420 hydrogenase/dehydrogenase, beta subunit C-terminal domain [uncultured Phocaeicola sp.]